MVLIYHGFDAEMVEEREWGEVVYCSSRTGPKRFDTEMV
jgi:hypothetical protein